MQFLLTRPLRDVTDFYGVVADVKFLLTRPLRDVTNGKYVCYVGSFISTHTPLAGRDAYVSDSEASCIYFYSHAPCGT